MQTLEALRLLEAKLAAIEQDHEAELAENEDLREQVDVRAEARALTAVFDFLQNCKIAPTDFTAAPLQALFARSKRSGSDLEASARPAVSRELKRVGHP